MDCYLDNITGASDVGLVVVGLVFHLGVGNGRLDDLIVDDLAVLGQF
jgi:hypothetical protein